MEEDPSSSPLPLHVLSGGFLTNRRVRRILQLAGWQIRVGLPKPSGHVGVWGARTASARGRAVAHRQGASLVTVEDAFLRSLFPGRTGEPTLGLLIDKSGVHFDGNESSDLETLLASHPLDCGELLQRASDAVARMKTSHLTKYSAVKEDLAPPGDGFVLFIDQAYDDASVLAGGGSRDLFHDMLQSARRDHPGAPIVIKRHPDSNAGFRRGCFDSLVTDGVHIEARPISPWRLFDAARAIYTHSSLMGFEAILAGHRPNVFGTPFYAGWDLTTDRQTFPRRNRHLTPEQLFAAAMILYPTWYDPYQDRLCNMERVLDTLEAKSRAWREDHRGYVASGFRTWKRPRIGRMLGRYGGIEFENDLAKARKRAEKTSRRHIVWASRSPANANAPLRRVEDGFLRSAGLGARLAPPLSICIDELGIYYDPTRESRLDLLIAASCRLDLPARKRSEELVQKIMGAGLGKYGAGQMRVPDLPAGRRILVAGQVEDDASVKIGTSSVSTNAGLIEAARSANPAAILVYKPHPDVLAGLRTGAVTSSDLKNVDVVLGETPASSALAAVDEVWTMTSTLGFEAMLRDLPVTCLGMPFYAGWGLTRDLALPPAWRTARPDIISLAHAVLIAYPRYFDPVTREPCPVEVAVDRIAKGNSGPTDPLLRLLAKLQGFRAIYRARKRH